jgi:hypothetical protein
MAGEDMCRRLSATEFLLRRKSFTYYFNVHMDIFDRAPAVSDDKQKILNPGTQKSSISPLMVLTNCLY